MMKFQKEKSTVIVIVSSLSSEVQRERSLDFQKEKSTITVTTSSLSSKFSGHRHDQKIQNLSYNKSKVRNAFNSQFTSLGY